MLTVSREWHFLKSPSPSPCQESSRLRELSISLFRDLVETVVEKDKRMMKKKVQRGLIPLFFHTHDGTESVAKVQISKLARDTGKGMLSPWTSGARAAGSQTVEACVTSGSNCPSH